LSSAAQALCCVAQAVYSAAQALSSAAPALSYNFRNFQSIGGSKCWGSPPGAGRGFAMAGGRGTYMYGFPPILDFYHFAEKLIL